MDEQRNTPLLAAGIAASGEFALFITNFKISRKNHCSDAQGTSEKDN
jgi:hypothetical protein